MSTPQPPTFRDTIDEIRHDLAREAAPLILLWREWVHRRTETVAFIDDIYIRRHQTVDFTIPEGLLSYDGVIYVPVALMNKEVLRDFDLRDAQGASLPMLTLRQNVKIAKQILVNGAARAAASRMKPETFEQRHPEIVTTFARIVEDDAPVAMRLADDLAEGAGPGDAKVLKKLSGSEFLIPLAKDFARNWMLIVPLPEEGPDRRIVKFAYDERLQRQTDPDSGKPLRKRMAKWRDDRLTALGIQSSLFAFPVPAVSEAESYHIEVVAPDDLIIQGAVIAEADPDAPDQQPEKVPDNRRIAGTGLATDRAHLHTSGRARGTFGRIYVTFRVRLSRIYGAARNISVATALLLGGGIVLHYGPHVPSHGQVAALLLVVLPGLYAAYLIRPGEHPLVQKIAAGVRYLIGLQAGVSFVAAASLALGFDSQWRHGIWEACFVVSLIGAVLTCWGAKRAAAQEKKEEGR